MKHPEDQAWDQIVERIELGVSDEQLADAERALRGVEAEEVRPEFVETMLARATAEAEVVEEVEVAQEPVKLRILPRLRRFAAAAAMLLFGTKLSAATTVTVLATATTVVVVLFQNSDELSYPELIQLLRDASNSREEKLAGLGWVTENIHHAVRDLRAIRKRAATPPDLADAIRTGLAKLARREWSFAQPVVDDIKVAVERVADVSLSKEERFVNFESAMSLAATGLDLMERFPDPSLVTERDALLGRLQAFLER